MAHEAFPATLTTKDVEDILSQDPNSYVQKFKQKPSKKREAFFLTQWTGAITNPDGSKLKIQEEAILETHFEPNALSTNLSEAESGTVQENTDLSNAKTETVRTTIIDFIVEKVDPHHKFAETRGAIAHLIDFGSQGGFGWNGITYVKQLVERKKLGVGLTASEPLYEININDNGEIFLTVEATFHEFLSASGTAKLTIAPPLTSKSTFKVNKDGFEFDSHEDNLTASIYQILKAEAIYLTKNTNLDKKLLPLSAASLEKLPFEKQLCLQRIIDLLKRDKPHIDQEFETALRELCASTRNVNGTDPNDIQFVESYLNNQLNNTLESTTTFREKPENKDPAAIWSNENLAFVLSLHRNKAALGDIQFVEDYLDAQLNCTELPQRAQPLPKLLIATEKEKERGQPNLLFVHEGSSEPTTIDALSRNPAISPALRKHLFLLMNLEGIFTLADDPMFKQDFMDPSLERKLKASGFHGHNYKIYISSTAEKKLEINIVVFRENKQGETLYSRNLRVELEDTNTDVQTALQNVNVSVIERNESQNNTAALCAESNASILRRRLDELPENLDEVDLECKTALLELAESIPPIRQNVEMTTFMHATLDDIALNLLMAYQISVEECLRSRNTSDDAWKNSVLRFAFENKAKLGNELVTLASLPGDVYGINKFLVETTKQTPRFWWSTSRKALHKSASEIQIVQMKKLAALDTTGKTLTVLVDGAKREKFKPRFLEHVFGLRRYKREANAEIEKQKEAVEKFTFEDVANLVESKSVGASLPIEFCEEKFDRRLEAFSQKLRNPGENAETLEKDFIRLLTFAEKFKNTRVNAKVASTVKTLSFENTHGDKTKRKANLALLKTFFKEESFVKLMKELGTLGLTEDSQQFVSGLHQYNDDELDNMLVSNISAIHPSVGIDLGAQTTARREMRQREVKGSFGKVIAELSTYSKDSLKRAPAKVVVVNNAKEIPTMPVAQAETPGPVVEKSQKEQIERTTGNGSIIVAPEILAAFSAESLFRSSRLPALFPEQPFHEEWKMVAWAPPIEFKFRETNNSTASATAPQIPAPVGEMPSSSQVNMLHKFQDALKTFGEALQDFASNKPGSESSSSETSPELGSLKNKGTVVVKLGTPPGSKIKRENSAKRIGEAEKKLSQTVITEEVQKKAQRGISFRAGSDE
ncbi:MAG TPA: hypothetical protein VGV92_06175 [Gammaproteobacteria bacterium]|nr:hypothetical protein [Gammaproteobacteria bacterium]